MHTLSVSCKQDTEEYPGLINYNELENLLPEMNGDDLQKLVCSCLLDLEF